ncbi:universal stress protein [Marinitenerispora sediminis]|uniref:Universal stress protein n=1 Tax=Marinitenerispora sediminis TaxID=1931232 RepID=A0A368T1E8_9ACTN|nr:universal stress protein [Marinitenerispora sediminis]RCV48742.1 universal stress protein [Marinitenerispora sediminis]RCV48753.1 universal stress protein [Marinitenerispora sediminis]RCV54187.1 universal stress protein [Marinitenerispora sediminis]
MTGGATAPLVTAVDGSEGGRHALEWAVDEARLRGLRLRVVHVYSWLGFRGAAEGAPEFDFAAMGRRIAERARDRAKARAPGLDVEAVWVEGDPGDVLLDEAEGAAMVVAGSRGASRLGAVFIGSTGLQLAALAPCPLVVVPHLAPRPATGRVVVGVDGSAAARAAAEWAFEEAALRSSVLRAVAVRGSASHGVFASLETPEPGPGTPEERAAQEEARRELSESVAGLRDRHPQVPVETEVAAGHAARTLTAESRGADLVVLGSRGRGGFAGMLLGSVSQTVLTHSACPVAVLHAPEE